MSRQQRRMAAWTAAGLFVLLVATLGGADPAPPLGYRRVFIPQADIDQQIRGLLPLKREEFDRRQKQAAARAELSAPLDQVRIDQATYQARLEGTALVSGEGEWTISSRREGPAALHLGATNLALRDAAWASAPSRPAQLGTGPDGQLVAIVPRSDRLAFRWSLAGRSDQRGELSFQLQLPPAPINRLQIELPAGAELFVDRGLATRPGQSPSAKNMWLVEAGGASQLALRVTQPAQQPRAESLVLVRETTVYSVQQATIDVETSLQLDVLQQPLEQLVLLLDESLQLTQVRMGEQLLDAVPLPAADGRRQVVIQFPQPLSGEGIVIQASGVAAWSSSARVRLPRIRVPAGTWQDGRATLSAPAALQLEAVPQVGGWQTGFSPSSPVRPQEQWQFQYYLADAAVEIAAANSPPPLSELSGVALDVQASQIQGTLTAELSGGSRPRFEVQARIPRAWIVDAVDVQPADMLEDRTLETRGAGPQILHIALRRPVIASRPLVVVVRAHRRRPAGSQPLPRDLAVMARFQDVRDARRLVELRASDPIAQIALSGDEDLARVDPAALTPTELRLFEDPPGGLLFELDQRADPLQVRLAPANPRYRAEALVRADIEVGQVRQTCRLRITPEDSLVDTLSVRLSPPPPEGVQWTIAGEAAREVVGQLVGAISPASDEAVYELKLQRPRRAGFEVVAQFVQPVVPTTRRAVISLASLPAAAIQSGLAEIHTTSDLPLAIEARGLRAVPPSARPAEATGTLRGAYRYEPGRVAALAVTSQPAGRTASLAWIESLQARSRISSDGSGDHEVELVIHNAGQRQFAFRLPAAAANLRVQMQGQAMTGSLGRRLLDEYTLPLAADMRVVTVRLAYTSPAAHWDWRPWGDVAIPLPQPELPVVDSDWQVQLAPGLTPRSAERAQLLESDSPAADWRPAWFNDLAPLAALPGETSETIAASSEDLPGWKKYALQPGSEPMATLAVYRAGVVSVWGWCLALVAAALVLRLAPTVGQLAGLGGILAAVALLLPQELAPLSGGMLVGLVLGGLLCLLRQPQARRPASQVPAAHRSTASLVARPLVLLLAMWAGLSAIGRAAPPAVWHRVVIPVDDERQPVGDYVFLEPAFYDALLRLTDHDPGGLPDWLLTTATYRPSLSVPAPDELSRLEQITAELDLETMRSDVTVELGFQRTQLHLVEGRTRLDGKPAVTEWSSAGRLRLSVPTPGKHRFELAFRPVVSADAGEDLCDVAVPQVADSRLVLAAGSPDVEAVDSHGSEDSAARAGQRVRHLAPTGRLVLRDPSGAVSAVAASVEAEQFVLWKLRPGSVVAEGRFRVRPLGGPVREVAIELDPRLRVLPLAGSQPIARQWLDERAGKSILHLVLSAPAATQTDLNVSFLWTGATGIGNLTLPRVSIQADKRIGDWAAISLATGLDWKISPPPAAEERTPEAFAATWGEPLATGAILLDAGPSASPAAISVEPDHGRIEAKQELTCSVSLKSAALRYSAHLMKVPPHAFQHRLSATAGLHVVRLEVREGERTVRAQWNQAADGSLVVQLAELPPAALEISVEAQATQNLPGSLALPLVQYQGAAEDELSVRIYRQADAQFDLAAETPSWKREEHPEQGRYQAGLGRLVGVLRRIGSAVAPAPQLAVDAMPHELGGVVLTRLVPGPMSWQLDVQCLLEVEAGVLDSLSFELPATLGSPLEITPAAEHDLSATAGGTTQRLLVRPLRAEGGQFRLSVRGPLRGGGDQAAIAHLVALVDAPRVRRLVALPRRDGEQRFEWETSGLQAVDSAAAPLPAGLLPAGYELFEAVSGRPTAAVQVGRPSPIAAQVLAADHQLRMHERGSVWGQSLLDVVPAGREQLTLAVPPGWRLIHVAVDTVPAQMTHRGGGQWEIQVASGRVPQRIEVVYARPAMPSDARGGQLLAVPRLAGLSVQRSLWRVAGQGILKFDQQGRAVDENPREHSVSRLEGLAAALESLSLASARELPPSVLQASLAAWDERFAVARGQLGSGLSPPLAARVAAAELAVEQAHQRLVEAGMPPADEPPPAAENVSADETAGRAWVASEDSDRVRAVLARGGMGPADVRLIWAGGMIALGLLAWRLLAADRVIAWLTQHAHFVAATIGMVWLAVGPAPWLGIMLLLLAMWRAVRSPWPRGSSVVLSSILRRPQR